MGEINLDDLRLTRHHQELLSFLIQSEEDERNFRSNYWTSTERQFWSVDAFRMNKLKENEMSLEEFQKEFEKDKIGALSKLFQQPVHQQDLEQFEKKVKENKLTQELLYIKHMENTRKPLQIFLTLRRKYGKEN